MDQHITSSLASLKRAASHGLRPRLSRRTIAVAIAAALLLPGVLGAAPVAAAPSADRVTELERVLDDTFSPANLERWHVPGILFVAVADGTVVVARGYGFADLAAQRPMDPERTIVRAGSVSKTFTAVAVMQLAEQGRLSLDEDVNRYLRRVKVPGDFAAPVTLRHLLTHTAGLGEYIHGQHPRVESDWMPLEAYLLKRLPPRLRPPGELFSYNDHGYSLAGLVVQDVSGLPYEEYVERSILEPLGMARSTFRQRPPDAFRNDLAVGYRFHDGRSVPYSPDWLETVPAAGLHTSAGDMARYLVALLGAGTVPDGGVRILSPASAATLTKRAFAHHPALRGRTLGFSEMFPGGAGILFHDGGMPGFNTRLVLAPARGWGFFVAWNADALAPKYTLTKAYLDLYYPGAERPAPAADSASEPATADLDAYTGTWAELDGLDRTGLKIGGVLEDAVTVTTAPPDGLRAFGSELHPAGPGLFRDADGDSIAFRSAADGGTAYLFAGTAAFRRMAIWEKPSSLVGLCILFVLVCTPVGLTWAAGTTVLRQRLGALWRRTLPAGGALAGLESLLIVVFLGSFLALFTQMDHYWRIMRVEFPWSWMTKLLALPLAIAALVLPLFVYAVRAWVRRDGTVLGRVVLSVVAATATLFVWVIAAWNLLGFRY